MTTTYFRYHRTDLVLHGLHTRLNLARWYASPENDDEPWLEVIDEDRRCLNLNEIDFSKVVFDTYFEEIRFHKLKSEGALLRLKKEKPDKIRLADNVLLALLADYRHDSENSILEWIWTHRGVEGFGFYGFMVGRRSDRPAYRREIFFVYRRDGLWRLSFTPADMTNVPTALLPQEDACYGKRLF